MSLRPSSGALSTHLVIPSRLGLARSRAACSKPRDLRCRLFKKLFGGGEPAPPNPKVDVPCIADEDLPFPKELLAPTFLAGKELALGFKGTRDGFDALMFHQKLDLCGPFIMVAETDDGTRFGGFDPEGMKSSDDYYASMKAFLFVWPKGYSEEMPIVLSKCGGPEAAVFDYARGGPQWGADALRIGAPKSAVMGGITGVADSETVAAGDMREASCRLGLAYECMPEEYGSSTSLFEGGRKKATLVEIEAYYAPSIAALY